LLALLRHRLVFTVHNAVPHGHTGRTHVPTAWIARLARQLVFVSEATRDDFLRRYGAWFTAKSVILRHGVLPVEPGQAPVDYRPVVRPEALVFWGTVKPYKGLELVAALARSAAWRAEGVGLEVHGRWDESLAPLRADLCSLGVRVVDGYLDAAALQALMARPVVFLLPYLHASQSGALYTLLHRGCHFLCADTGDLGAFLRQQGLPQLLLAARTPEAVIGAMKALAAAPGRVAAALQQAQDDTSWDCTLADADLVFAPAA
jgi:glycosyltransferase involved in cell wall biosynthesis